MTHPRTWFDRAQDWLLDHSWLHNAVTLMVIAALGLLFALAMILLLPWEPKP